jgi:hypothetical protein
VDSEVAELLGVDVEEEGALEIAEVCAKSLPHELSQNLMHGVLQVEETSNKVMDRQPRY